MRETIELIDLVDTEGVLIEAGVPRDDIQEYEGHMRIVIAVVTNSAGQILVHQRAQTKRVNPGDVDHVCGAVVSGESPEDAARRETLEETGVELNELQVVREGVNTYGRYCILFAGLTDGEPSVQIPEEVAWARYYHPEELRTLHASNELTFVDGFFDDLDTVLQR